MRLSTLSGWTFAAAAAFGAQPSAVQAAIILVEDIVQITGPVLPPPVKVKTATGQVSITSPTGVTTTRDMPPAGGRIEVFGGVGTAIAGARVDLERQRKSSGWVVDSASGWSASAKADIDVRWEQPDPVLVTTTYRTSFFFFRQDLERIDGYFSPGVEGLIDYRLQLLETGSGASLFDARLALTHESPDVVTDPTGALSWIRTPGPFGGLGGVGVESPVPDTAFSDNRWELDIVPQAIDFDITLEPGESLGDYQFALVTTASGELTGPAGASVAGHYGVSDAVIPLPPTIAMMLAGLAALGLSSAVGARRSQRAV